MEQISKNKIIEIKDKEIGNELVKEWDKSWKENEKLYIEKFVYDDLFHVEIPEGCTIERVNFVVIHIYSKKVFYR